MLNGVGPGWCSTSILWTTSFSGLSSVHKCALAVLLREAYAELCHSTHQDLTHQTKSILDSTKTAFCTHLHSILDLQTLPCPKPLHQLLLGGCCCAREYQTASTNIQQHTSTTININTLVGCCWHSFARIIQETCCGGVVMVVVVWWVGWWGGGVVGESPHHAHSALWRSVSTIVPTADNSCFFLWTATAFMRCFVFMRHSTNNFGHIKMMWNVLLEILFLKFLGVGALGGGGGPAVRCGGRPGGGEPKKHIMRAQFKISNGHNFVVF